jgi:hypothetical protein
MKTLEYYFDNGTHVIFNKYTIDGNGVIRNKKTGKVMAIHTNKNGYNNCSVRDNSGKQRSVLVGRSIISTFEGPPPTPDHTADHKNRNRGHDMADNIRWLCKKEQCHNQERPEEYKSSLIIVKDGVEKTVKEWVDYLKDDKNHMGRDYTKTMVGDYARKKQHGFSYKEYPDLVGEVWKEISGSRNARGRWEISNMNRVKYITKHAENVLSGERLCLRSGYPKIMINGHDCSCHIIAFKTFYPEDWIAKKPNEIVLHEDDDRLDFRPHKLRLGTQSENTTDAYDNGCYDCTKSAMMRCASYINGIFEREYNSQSDVVRYLKIIGFDKASQGTVGMSLRGERETAYGRTWKRI